MQGWRNCSVGEDVGLGRVLGWRGWQVVKDVGFSRMSVAELDVRKQA